MKERVGDEKLIIIISVTVRGINAISLDNVIVVCCVFVANL